MAEVVETARKKYDLDRVVRLVITIVCIVAGIYVINYLSGVLLPFLVGCLLAYVLNPCVEFFMRLFRTKKRTVPALLTIVLFFGVIILLCILLLPYVASEFADMSKMLARYAAHEFKWPNLPPAVQAWIETHLNPDALSSLLSAEQWSKLANKVLTSTFSVVGGTVSAILTAVSWLLALLYMFFVMIDYDKISRGFKAAVPPRYRRMTFRIFRDVTDTMSRYFRGQALVSLFVGIIFAIEFRIIGLPMAIVFGLSIGVLNMVPYLQLISIPVAAFLCLVASVSSGGSFLSLFAWTIVAYCVCQLIQDMVLTPTIMKKQMGLRPAIVFLALSVWSYVLGFIGLIIALPLTTLIFSYYQEFVLHTPRQGKSQPADKK